MGDISQEDIFVIEKAEKVVQSSKGVPSGFVPVTFLSEDKLGPSVLHFRNYSMGEMLELASATEDNLLDVLTTRILNNICFEKYDCSKLHIENIKEIMLTIHVNFWGRVLKNKAFYKDLNAENMDAEENIGYVDIDIQNLKANKIDPKFKVPFTIVDSITNKKVKFVLPTVEHVLIADKFIKEKYYIQEDQLKRARSLIDTKQKLEDKQLFDKASEINVTQEDFQKVEDLERQKGMDYLKVIQSQLIHGVDGKVCETVEDKLKAFHEDVDSTSWMRYAEAVKKYATFGYNDEYTFKYGEENMTRRFSFRLLDLIPSMDETGDVGYTVSFDD